MDSNPFIKKENKLEQLSLYRMYMRIPRFSYHRFYKIKIKISSILS